MFYYSKYNYLSLFILLVFISLSNAQDGCSSGECVFGNCVNDTCECFPGFIGVYCNINDTNSPCPPCVYGSCQYGICQCYSGYGGPSCDAPITTPNITVPPSIYNCDGQCQNGYCQNNYCNCQYGYTGDRCENRVGQVAFNSPVPGSSKVFFQLSNYVTITSGPATINEVDMYGYIVYSVALDNIQYQGLNEYYYFFGNITVLVRNSNINLNQYQIGNQVIPTEFGNVATELYIMSWPFQSTLNSLEINYETTLPSGYYSCGETQAPSFQSETPINMPNYNYISTSYGSVFSQYFSFAIADGHTVSVGVETPFYGPLNRKVVIPYFSNVTQYVTVNKAYYSVSNTSCGTTTSYTTTSGYPPTTYGTTSLSPTTTTSSSNPGTESSVQTLTTTTGDDYETVTSTITIREIINVNRIVINTTTVSNEYSTLTTTTTSTIKPDGHSTVVTTTTLTQGSTTTTSTATTNKILSLSLLPDRIELFEIESNPTNGSPSNNQEINYLFLLMISLILVITL